MWDNLSTATGTQVPWGSRKAFQKVFVPLTVRVLRLTNLQARPAAEQERRFTVHPADVKARILHTHWTQNQLWRIPVGNLHHRWTKNPSISIGVILTRIKHYNIYFQVLDTILNSFTYSKLTGRLRQLNLQLPFCLFHSHSPQEWSGVSTRNHGFVLACL